MTDTEFNQIATRLLNAAACATATSDASPDQCGVLHPFMTSSCVDLDTYQVALAQVTADNEVKIVVHEARLAGESATCVLESTDPNDFDADDVSVETTRIMLLTLAEIRAVRDACDRALRGAS